tara:strand:- start:72 stop:452 length:381 start_codon:yes stop_codon:yes gene_type:complete
MNNLTTILLLGLTISFFIYKKKKMNENAISVDLLRSKLKTEQNIGVIDVRTTNEYNGPKGHIPGSLSIPLSNISNQLDEIKSKKFDELYVICLSGARSASALSVLNKNGIKAQNVKGGMMAWNRMK